MTQMGDAVLHVASPCTAGLKKSGEGDTSEASPSREQSRVTERHISTRTPRCSLLLSLSHLAFTYHWQVPFFLYPGYIEQELTK